MSLDTMRSYAENSLATFMNANYPSVPVKYSNVPWRQPETEWVDIHVLDGKAFAAELGRVAVDRHVGLLQVDVLVPRNTGTSAAFQLIEAICNIWRKVDVSLSDNAVVKFRIPEFHDMGENGGFYRVCGRVPYIRDEPRK